MTYLGDPSYFNRLIPGNVTIYGDGTVVDNTTPLVGNTWAVPHGGLTYEHISPGLVYGAPAQPWHVYVNQLIALAQLDDPAPPIEVAPEPFSAPQRRRAMVLDGDIPVGA